MSNVGEEGCSPGETASAGTAVDVKPALLTKRADVAQRIGEIDASVSRLQAEYSERLEQFETQRKPLEEALRHIDALLQLEGYSSESKVGDVNGNDTRNVVGAESITDGAFGLLKELRKPLHYKDIATRLEEKSVRIPGKDPAATLLSRMSRDNRFKRTASRGVYALSAWRTVRANPKRLKARREKTGNHH